MSFLRKLGIYQYPLLREMETISRETTPSNLFCFPSEKGSTLKGKTLLPPSKHTPLQERRYNVAATSRRCIDVIGTLCVCWDGEQSQ